MGDNLAGAESPKSLQSEHSSPGVAQRKNPNLEKSAKQADPIGGKNSSKEGT